MSTIAKLMDSIPHEVVARSASGALRLEATPSRIHDFEVMIQYQLPDDYRMFLERYSGVAVQNIASFPQGIAEVEGEGIDIDVFFGFYSELAPSKATYEDIVYRYKMTRESLPAAVVPIGGFEQNLICVNCEPGPNYGWVLLKYPEETVEDHSRELCLILTASFVDFLRTLCPRDLS